MQVLRRVAKKGSLSRWMLGVAEVHIRHWDWKKGRSRIKNRKVPKKIKGKPLGKAKPDTSTPQKVLQPIKKGKMPKTEQKGTLKKKTAPTPLRGQTNRRLKKPKLTRPTGRRH